MIFIHGGGWSVGDLDTYDGIARRHVVGADAIVVSIDYRLAPEHPYPAAVDDAWAATQWVAEHATDLGGDPDLLAVAGDSAGGNLAAVVSQLARDAGGPRILFQLLWYPATTFDTSLPSFTENANAPILDFDGCKGCTRWYIGDLDVSDMPATLACGMPNCSPPQACPSNCTMPDARARLCRVRRGRACCDGGRRAGHERAAQGVALPMSSQNSVDIVHAFWDDAWNAHDSSAVDSFVVDDFVIVTGGVTVSGRENFKKWIDGFLVTWT